MMENSLEFFKTVNQPMNVKYGFDFQVSVYIIFSNTTTA